MRSHETNMKCLASPVPGDYWHEMFLPVAKVLEVDSQYVLLDKFRGRPVRMTRASFSKWLRYSTIPEKTWADVYRAEARP